ncbi:MAG: tetratricopeptide repeat protein [Pseudomonadota bacterium]
MITRNVLFYLLIAFSVPLGLGLANASDSGTNTASVVKSEDDPMKSMFYKLWNKIKGVSPQVETAGTEGDITLTAGIRGSEATEDLLSPYWKNDLSQDPDYVNEISLFSQGNRLAVDGNLEKAIVAFESFLKNYPQSDLLANAQFALGVAYSQSGEQGQAVKVLSEFIDNHESHILASDARDLLELMI